ncbi:MAG: glucosaminidase domain-containing protein [Desulfobacteraceae bacterium]|nr:glucosaminidase domain-containing protein [Desulfobacteraceae bacterium]
MLSGKRFVIPALCVFFVAAVFLNACGRTNELSEDITPEEVIGKVELPPLNNGGEGSAEDAAIKAEFEKNEAGRRENKPIPENVNTKLPDFTQYKDVKTKKTEFFNFLRPIIRKENYKVLKERAYVLLKWKRVKNGEQLKPEEVEYLKKLAEKYRVKSKYSEGAPFFRDLLLHIDKIPVDLALIQAAKESGWGTSYFARKGNNLFGQWCFEEGCGIVPRRRPEGASYEVKTFDNVADSVRAYIRNLNSHPAYKDLRIQRYRMRLAGREPDGHYMAAGLERYSGIGMQYVRTVRQMIRGNQRFMGIHGSTGDA